MKILYFSIEEYFFEDWGKIGLVLGDNQKIKNEAMQFLEKSSDANFYALFGKDTADENVLIRPSYRWRESAFKKPEAYIGIYSQD